MPTERAILHRGEPFVAERGRVAHRLEVDGGSYTLAACGRFLDPAARRAMLSDRPCRRCVELALRPGRLSRRPGGAERSE